MMFLGGVPFKLPLVKTAKGDITHNPNIPAAQQGMANASYVPTPVARENFRPREPVHMQQHALSIGNSVHTEAQIDIGLTAADVQFHTLCKEHQRTIDFRRLLAAGDVSAHFVLQNNLLPHISDGLYGLFLLGRSVQRLPCSRLRSCKIPQGIF